MQKKNETGRSLSLKLQPEVLGRGVIQRCVLAGASVLLTAAAAQGATRSVAVPPPGGDIRANIQAAVDASVDGDTVLIPAGTFPLSGTVLITRFVSVQGSSKSETVLYRDEATPDASLASVAMFNFSIQRTQPSGIRVRGLTLRSKQPSLVAGDSGSRAADIGIRFREAVDFKVEGCRFENFGNSAIVVTHRDDLARGLITRNEFFHNAKGFDGLGLGYGVAVYGTNQSWVPNPQFGSNNFITIENNKFDFHRHAIAAGGAALYVARYNVITNNIIANGVATQAIDAHEGRGGTPGNANFFATRAVEAYGNTIINTTFRPDANGQADPIVPGQDVARLGEAGVYIRGGEALIHDNTVAGYRFALGLTEEFGTNTGASYPVPYASGYASGNALGVSHTGEQMPEADGDTFYCSNSFTPYPSPHSVEFHNYRAPGPSFPGLQEGRDYHATCKPNYVPSPYPHPAACEAGDKTPCLELPLVHYAFDAPNLGLDSSNLHYDGQVLAARTSGFSMDALLAGANDGVREFHAVAPSLNLLGKASGIAWVKPAGAHAENSPDCSAGTVFTKGGNLTLLVARNNRELWFENDFTGDGLHVAEADIPVGAWTQLAFTRDENGVVQLYRNGVPLGPPQPRLVSPTANDAEFVIGYGTDDAPASCEFNGAIDEVKIFDRVLSPVQVAAEFHAGFPQTPVPLFAVPVRVLLGLGLTLLGRGALRKR